MQLKFVKILSFLWTIVYVSCFLCMFSSVLHFSNLFLFLIPHNEFRAEACYITSAV